MFVVGLDFGIAWDDLQRGVQVYKKEFLGFVETINVCADAMAVIGKAF
jgi:hypothetical protein